MNITEILEAELNEIKDKALIEYIVNEMLFDLHCYIKKKTEEFHKTMEHFEKLHKEYVNI